ncbi:MAG: D-glycero-beta-D-manno-heptose-7-phosphate kinase [Deltaproteobacteria bacterium]|nr:D-glycero-beta-D-manno-heptose-7-phosphate kinase [Deltaproteobacteria bacterium]
MTKIVERKRVLEIIKKFSDAKVLVVGDLMVDHFIWGRVSRISPEAPVPVVEVQSDNFMLGGSGNVLNNIHSLGGKVYGTGVVGNDEMGQKLREEFRKRRIDTDGIVVEDNRPTTLKTRIVAHSQQVVRFDRENRKPITPASVGKMIEYAAKLRDDLGAIVISDYNKGVISKPLLDGIRGIVAGSSIKVCVDPKQNDFSLYHDFDIITPNHHEAGRAAGTEIVDGHDVVRTGRIILDRFRFKALLITRGEEGMNLFERDGETTHTVFPAQAREVYDVTGAGDTVIGVFALSVASGATLREAAVLANHAAGIVVGKVGTATITQDELRKVL